MISEAYENLKKELLISNDNVEQLRQNIKIKYPGCSGEEAAAIFACEIRRKIDDDIIDFNKKYKKRIIDRLIRKAVYKDRFQVCANEVFESCLELKSTEHELLESLEKWLNGKQSHFISIHEIITLVEAFESIEVIDENTLSKFFSATKTKRQEQSMDKHSNKQKISVLLVLLSIAAIIFFSYSCINDWLDGIALKNDTVIQIQDTKNKFTDELSEELKYVKIDEVKLKKWLNNKNSKLVDEPYFTAIMKTAGTKGVNPLFLFAITGQEQGFVPKDNRFAEKIANNPFNVFGSWEIYNTNIYDSASIAADLIISASKERPIEVNAVKWINRKYAEDPCWWQNVTLIFEEMKNEIY